MGNKKIYLIGSLKNPTLTEASTALRAAGHEVFDDWWAAGPKADSYWQDYEAARGRTYKEALTSPIAVHNFEFDKKWLDWADTGVLVLPAGKSAHMEVIEVQKHGTAHALFPAEPKDKASWDLMYKLLDGIHFSIEELLEALE
jgi:hypothetical protein